MIVKCIREPKYGGITKNEIYMVVSIEIIKEKPIHYRLVSDIGVTALYEGELFDIINSSLTEMNYTEKRGNIAIELTDIQVLSEKTMHLDGVWGEYYDTKDVSFVKEVHNAIKKYAKKMNYPIVEPIRFY